MLSRGDGALLRRDFRHRSPSSNAATGGFTTRDLKRPLDGGLRRAVFNWNLFVAAAGHRTQTRHAGHTNVTITSSHGEPNRARQALTALPASSPSCEKLRSS
jgi:hypothetical protein